MAPKHQRLAFAVFGLTLLIAAALIILNRFSEHLVFFYTPTQLLAATDVQSQIRLGGLVETGSIQQDGMKYQFKVTDLKQAVNVAYEGVPPSLFREGQGVVVEGGFKDGIFTADRLLAKHDENYMPPEVAKALKENGYWKEEGTPHDPVSAQNPLLQPDSKP